MPILSRTAPAGPRRLTLALGAALLLGLTPLARADNVMERMATEGTVGWRNSNPTGPIIAVQVVGLNDLHGHLTAAAELQDAFEVRRAGGAAALSGVINAERLSNARRTIVLFAGDSIGGSPPLSGLLRDEPMLEFMNYLAFGDCKPMQRQANPEVVTGNPVVVTRCHLVATVGNHEFDHGSAELERQLYGGPHPDGPVLGHVWAGSKVTWLGGNVVRAADDKPFLPGAAIMDLEGIHIGIIGIVTSETAALEPKGRVDDLHFLPEVPAINASIARLKAAKVDAIILLIHEGLTAPTSPQVLPIGPGDVSGRLGQILTDIDPGVDLVVSGHTHQFSNILFRGKDPRPMLVTQARVDGTSYSTAQLLIDPAKHAVVEKSATVQTVWSQGDPGRRPDEKVAKLIKAAAAETAPRVARVVGQTAGAITREPSESGESALGNLVADAHRAAAHADIAFMNAGGLRADLPAGDVTWGALYTVQPFGNRVMRCTMTGAQVLRLLESQWSGAHRDRPTILKVSGLSYLYNWSRPSDHRVVAAYDATGANLDPQRRYSVAVNDYLLGGGDGYPVFTEVTDGVEVTPDIDALVAYVTATKGPVAAKIEGRITRVAGK